MHPAGIFRTPQTQTQTSVEDPPLWLEDLLNAAAACRSWRCALSHSPTLGSLSIGDCPAGKQAWIERAHPGARRLYLDFSAAKPQGQAVLRALTAEVRCSAKGLPRACQAALLRQSAWKQPRGSLPGTTHDSFLRPCLRSSLHSLPPQAGHIRG